MKTIPVFALALAAGLVIADVSVADDTTVRADDDVTIVTDFRGSPPFARRVVSAQEADSKERVSEEAAEDAADRIQVVEMRGAPPYKRSFVEREALEQAEFARFEETSSDADARSTRRGPPGKLTTRR